MLIQLIQKLQRRKQLALFRKNKNISLGSIKIGIGNHFIFYPNLKKITFGKSLNFRNYIHIIVQENATLEIGDHVFLNNFCSINCLHYISIGENTLFGENVRIYDHNHLHVRKENKFTISHSEFTKAPVKIGKNCWLASNATILKGVTIGDNCIIGAGCTIYKDIPANSTVVNNQDLKFL